VSINQPLFVENAEMACQALDKKSNTLYY